MPTVKELIDIYADATGEPRTRVNQLARRLIDDGLMPKSSGSDIKQVDAASALNLLFAIAFADRVANAPEIARQIAGLRRVPDHDERAMATLPKTFAIPPDGNLGEVAIALLEPKVEADCQIELIRNQEKIYFAKIKIRIDPKKIKKKSAILKKVPEVEGYITLAVVELVFSNGDLNGDLDETYNRVYRIGFNGFYALRTILPLSEPPMSEPVSGGGDG